MFSGMVVFVKDGFSKTSGRGRKVQEDQLFLLMK
jgi:hypothetical protein